MTEEVKTSFYSSLENEKNAEISSRLVSEITQQIEQCLTKMAQIVEIPL
jgi:predicted XRE-type DNA-binding protein